MTVNICSTVKHSFTMPTAFILACGKSQLTSPVKPDTARGYLSHPGKSNQPNIWQENQKH